jgi:hypothetical protein
MTQQPQNETQSPSKGGPGNLPQTPDQKPGKSSQAGPKGRTNQASTGRSADSSGAEHSSTKNLETEPDRAQHNDRNE